MRAKTFLIFILLIIMAFGGGYGYGYWKWYTAEKEWAAAKNEMQSKIITLEGELTRAKAREALWELTRGFSQTMVHLSEKNFGLAAKTLEQMKETFLTIQPNLDEGWKTPMSFLVPALEEVKKEVENVGPEAKKKIEDLQNLFDQTLKSGKKA